MGRWLGDFLLYCSMAVAFKLATMVDHFRKKGLCGNVPPRGLSIMNFYV